MKTQMNEDRKEAGMESTKVTTNQIEPFEQSEKTDVKNIDCFLLSYRWEGDGWMGGWYQGARYIPVAWQAASRQSV